MIYKISQLYVDRQESSKNWKIFAAYLTAATFAAVSLQLHGARIAPLGMLALGAAAWFHWKLNQVHRCSTQQARLVEVEIINGRLAWRCSPAEQSIDLGHLVSVSQASKFEPIKLEFSSGEPLQINGLENSDLLVNELSNHVRH